MNFTGSIDTTRHRSLPTRFFRPGSHEFSIVEENNPRRSDVEVFVAERFAEVHDAKITSFMPQMLALYDSHGSIRAAIGVRGAGLDGLFLEHYFDQPIEQIILDVTCGEQQSINRRQIVEVGNLASVDRFASRRLFEMLALYLIKTQFQWIVFTGCSSLRRLFKRMRLELVVLGQAEETRIPSAFGSWGRYYDDNPQVMLGHLSGGITLAEQASYVIPKEVA